MIRDVVAGHVIEIAGLTLVFILLMGAVLAGTLVASSLVLP